MNKSGKVTAVAKGDTIIVGKNNDTGDVVRIGVRVTSGKTAEKETAASTPKASGNKMFFFKAKAGDNIELGTTFGSKADVTWSSSKTSVATVNKNGKITAVAKGDATIKVKNNTTGEEIKIGIRVAN